jgi:hypothetical protein
MTIDPKQALALACAVAAIVCLLVPTFRGGGGLPSGTRPDPRAMLGSPLYWAGLGLMAVAVLLLAL